MVKKKFSPEHLKNMSEATKKMWQDPEFRKKQAKRVVEGKYSKEVKAKISKSVKKLWEDPEYYKNHSEKTKLLWQDPEFRKKQAKKVAEGKYSKEVREKMSINRKRHFEKHPETREAVSLRFKKLWQDPEFVEKMITEEKYKKISEKAKDRWANNPEYREKAIKSILEASQNSPNKLEKYFNTILEKNFPNTWNFVGDGQKVINGKCPDFINKDQTHLIEVFGDYWHEGEDPQDRINVFAKSNFKTLVLWESEINTSIEDCISRVREFSCAKELRSIKTDLVCLFKIMN